MLPVIVAKARLNWTASLRALRHENEISLFDPKDDEIFVFRRNGQGVRWRWASQIGWLNLQGAGFAPSCGSQRWLRRVGGEYLFIYSNSQLLGMQRMITEKGKKGLGW